MFSITLGYKTPELIFTKMGAVNPIAYTDYVIICDPK